MRLAETPAETPESAVKVKDQQCRGRGTGEREAERRLDAGNGCVQQPQREAGEKGCQPRETRGPCVDSHNISGKPGDPRARNCSGERVVSTALTEGGTQREKAHLILPGSNERELKKNNSPQEEGDGATREGLAGAMANAFLRKLTAIVQKYRTGLLVASCTGVFGANISYHVFPEQTFKTVYQSWSKGEPSELPGKLQNVFQEVLEDVGVKSPTRYRAFAAFGFLPVSAGIPWLPSGSLVGIPVNFSNQYDDGEEITTRVVMLNGKVVEWDSKYGDSLKEALSLSEEAKKFALAREITYVQNNSPLLQATVAPVCILGTCLSGVAIKQILGLYSGPGVLRGLFNVAIMTVGLIGYYFAHDAVSQWLDYRCDRTTATISKDYAHGGVEFYDKILLRNRTVRHFMGKQGEEMYAVSGNLFPKYWFRLKNVPYTSRREMIVNIVKNNQD